MKIICLEGCHGVGKTTLINDLQRSGQIVLDEMFLDMPTYKVIQSQSLTMETLWVSKWMNRLLELRDQHANETLFADRSPYSAIYYSKSSPQNQQILKTLIDEQIRILKQHNIFVFTICLVVNHDLLWKRILCRLEFEPERKQYNEDSRKWMEETS